MYIELDSENLHYYSTNIFLFILRIYIIIVRTLSLILIHSLTYQTLNFFCYSLYINTLQPVTNPYIYPCTVWAVFFIENIFNLKSFKFYIILAH